MAEQALAFHLDGLEQDGEALPEPSSLETVMGDPENRDGVAILVPAPNRAARSVQINITLPADVLSEIDRYAEAHGLTRSGFLARAAMRATAE